ncbi:MAG: hypothetical protein QNK03_11055 [Myxococcota bacterium]|nr:hypothetical protein [Myxococcota bacterium]
MRNRARLVVFAFLLVALAVAAPRGATADEHGGETTAWDQARVTELAVQLAVVMRDLRFEARRSIPSDLAMMQAHSRHTLLDTLRLLRNETRYLAAELEAGQGYAETLPIARRIDALIDRAARDARRIKIPAPVLAKVERADALVEQLRPFYTNFEPSEAAGG